MKETVKNKKHSVRKWIVAIIIGALIIFLGITIYQSYFSPIHSCESFLEAYQQGDAEKITELLDVGKIGGNVQLGEYTDILSEKMTFKINGFKDFPFSFSDTRYLHVEITNIDFEALVNQKDPWENVEDEEPEGYHAALRKAVLSENAPCKQYVVDIVLTKQDGEWKIKMTDDFSNALLGNFPYYYRQLINQIIEEEAK